MATKDKKIANAAFRMSIHDVLDYDEWSGCFKVTHPSLMQVCQSRLEEILVNDRLRGMRSGEVTFFLSQDKKRARVVLCLSKKPSVYSVGTVSFENHSPELVMSLWLGDRLRSAGLAAMAARVDAMNAEERLKAWHDLQRRMSAI